jgi:hypothetical protein
VNTWQDLVTASLIGTERAPVPPVRIPGWLAPDNPAAGDQGTAKFTPSEAPDQAPVLLDPAEMPLDPAEMLLDPAKMLLDPAALLLDPAEMLLDRAALLTAARRAGRPAGHAEPPSEAGPDPRPQVNPAAADRLAWMLRGTHSDLLTEWLAAAAGRGVRVPAQLLPGLLDRAPRVSPADPELRRLAAAVGGPRARWLAGLNAEWAWVAADTPRGDDAWRLGDAGQRRDYLTALRAADPGLAGDLVTASWDAAGAAERAMFLSVLAAGPALRPADEPLLQAALSDRADEVRSRAAYLLASLPGSALGRRMAERARRGLRLETGPRGPRLIASPPAECDASMRRDGITPGPGAGRSQLADRTRLMLEVVARTPLSTWTDSFALGPAAILAVPSGDWAPVLFVGWSRAAIAQRNQDWVAALINEALTGRPPAGPAENGALSQLARRADPGHPALGAPDALAEPEPGAPLAVRSAIRVLRFRYDMLKELDVDYSRG